MGLISNHHAMVTAVFSDQGGVGVCWGEWFFRLPVFYKFDAPMTKDQLCHVVNDLTPSTGGSGILAAARLRCTRCAATRRW